MFTGGSRRCGRSTFGAKWRTWTVKSSRSHNGFIRGGEYALDRRVEEKKIRKNILNVSKQKLGCIY